MRIMLIQPKMNKRPMDTDFKTQMSPPLGLYTLLNLTPPHHETLLVNENIEDVPLDYPADLVGITVTLDVFPRAVHLASLFRLRGVPVVAGGIHVTCCPDECAPHFDAVCVGPAERVWASMLQDAEEKNLRTVYKDMANFQGEEIVSPSYDKIDRRKYLYTNIVTTSRGCPRRCDFCYNSCENRAYVRRPIPDVIKDVKALNARHVYFVDDNFIGDPQYTRELLTELNKIGLTWNAAVTTKIIDHLDLLDFMVETGCQSLFIGFESVNNQALAEVHKDNDSESYGRLVDELHKRGIMINASMVFGLDGDGLEVFENTLDWLVKNRIETLTAHILTPYPGTRLYHNMKASNRITDYDLAHYNTSHVVFKPLNIEPEELYRGYLNIYRRFYSFPCIMARKPENPKQRKAYFLFNFLYRKYGGFFSRIQRIIPMRSLGQAAEWLSYKGR